MASRSVALVNRLRLGEAPSAADAVLAVRLLALDGACADYLDLVADLQETAAGEASPRRLRARLAVLGETARLLESAIESMLPALARYFSVRAEVEGEAPEPVGEDAGEEPEVVDEEPSASVDDASSVVAALADLAVPARVGEALDASLSALEDHCRRCREGLASLLSSEPDTETTLDYLSTLEADVLHALHGILRADFTEGEVPYRAGLVQLAGEALATR